MNTAKSLFLALLAVPLMTVATPLVTIGKTQTPPVLDGHLEDKAWQQAIELTNFVKLGELGQPATRSTSVRLTYDATNLYLAWRCEEPVLHPVLNKLHEFKATCTEDDAPSKLWNDDLVEIFLAPDIQNTSSYVHLALNSRGALYDAHEQKAPSWNSNAQRRTLTWHQGTHQGGWNLEMAIPFASLGVKAPVAGTRWKANFGRLAQSIKETSSWAQAASLFHSPSIFGTLVFADRVPAVSDISQLNSFKGKGDALTFTCPSPLQADLLARFSNGDQVSFAPRQLTTNQRAIPVNLDTTNHGYTYAATTGEITDTFLRTGHVTLKPGRSYTLSALVKSSNAWRKAPQPVSLIYLVQKKAGYQAMPLDVPADTHGTWVTLRGTFTNKTDTTGWFWFINWNGNNVNGTISFDDFSLVDNETGEELLRNGDFSSQSSHWSIFRKKLFAPSYGCGAETVTLTYQFKRPDQTILYQSPDFRFRIAKDFTTIKSALVHYGSDGLLTPEILKLAPSAPETINLLLTKDQSHPVQDVQVELFMPQEVRLLPPDAITAAPTPRSISEAALERNGHAYRRYLLTFGPEVVNRDDAEFNALGCISLLFMADSPTLGTLPPVEYRATLNGAITEPQFHRLRLELVRPPAGIQPTTTLPLVLWVYANCPETKHLGPALRELLNRKIADAGYTMVQTSHDQVASFKDLHVNAFPMVDSFLAAGPYYFPGLTTFLREHPEAKGVSAQGQQREDTIDPAVFLQPNSPVIPYLETLARLYLKSYPDEIHIDYESGVMPRAGQTLPDPWARTNLGYSPRNLRLFQQKYKLPENLTPTIIHQKYSQEWLDFRNGQTADIIGLFARIVKKQKPTARFSVYSGYPPYAEKNYGIDWKKLAPKIDLCLAGYGGNDQLLLDSIPQNFFNSGLLMMGFVDSSTLADTFLGMLMRSGSYMGYTHATVDGGYFRQSSVTAALAAAFEPFFLNLKRSRAIGLTTNADGSPVSGAISTYSHQERILNLISNQTDAPLNLDLKTKVDDDYVAVHYGTRKAIPLKQGRYQITVAPHVADAVLLAPRRILGTHVQPPELRTTIPARHPVLRWYGLPQELASYQVRYATSPAGLAQAKVFDVIEPNLVIGDALPAGPFHWQVRTVSCFGQAGPWSLPRTDAVVLAPTLNVKRHPALEQSPTIQLTNWQYFSWGSGANLATCSLDRKNVPAGDTLSLRIDHVCDSTQSYWTNFRTNGAHGAVLEAEPGQTYRLTAMVRTSGNIQGNVSLCLLNAASKQLKAQGQNFSACADWTAVSCDLTVPKGAQYLKLYFGATNGSGTAWCSNVRLQSISK